MPPQPSMKTFPLAGRVSVAVEHTTNAVLSGSQEPGVVLLLPRPATIAWGTSPSELSRSEAP